MQLQTAAFPLVYGKRWRGGRINDILLVQACADFPVARFNVVEAEASVGARGHGRDHALRAVGQDLYFVKQGVARRIHASVVVVRVGDGAGNFPVGLAGGAKKGKQQHAGEDGKKAWMDPWFLGHLRVVLSNNAA